MPTFKEMDPEIIRRMIQGQKDVLSPEVQKQNAFYNSFTCPKCKGPMDREHRPGSVFDGQSVLPKSVLRCPICSLLMDPHTNLVIETGREIVLPIEVSFK